MLDKEAQRRLRSGVIERTFNYKAVVLYMAHHTVNRMLKMRGYDTTVSINANDISVCDANTTVVRNDINDKISNGNDHASLLAAASIVSTSHKDLSQLSFDEFKGMYKSPEDMKRSYLPAVCQHMIGINCMPAKEISNMKTTVNNDVIDQVGTQLKISTLLPVLVLYLHYDKFDIKTMRNLVAHLYELKIDHAIVLTDSKPTPQSKKEVVGIELLHIEFYTYTSMLHNVTDHVLLPISVALVTLTNNPNKESIDINERNLHTPLTTPLTNELTQVVTPVDACKEIAITDPICTYLGLQAGQVVRISHYDEPSELRRVVL